MLSCLTEIYRADTYAPFSASAMSEGTPVVFSVLEEKYCVAKLPANAPIPAIDQMDGLLSITRTPEELSIVCKESACPEASEIERNWRVIKVAGPLEFALKGVLVSLLKPLADANVSVFALSTYDTDYILIQQYHFATTLEALELAGHRLTPG